MSFSAKFDSATEICVARCKMEVVESFICWSNRSVSGYFLIAGDELRVLCVAKLFICRSWYGHYLLLVLVVQCKLA